VALVRKLLFAACGFSFLLAALFFMGDAGCDPPCHAQYTAEIVVFAILGVICAVIAIRLIGWEERHPGERDAERSRDSGPRPHT
jgi:hypothetical protein